MFLRFFVVAWYASVATCLPFNSLSDGKTTVSWPSPDSWPTPEPGLWPSDHDTSAPAWPTSTSTSISSISAFKSSISAPSTLISSTSSTLISSTSSTLISSTSSILISSTSKSSTPSATSTSLPSASSKSITHVTSSTSKTGAPGLLSRSRTTATKTTTASPSHSTSSSSEGSSNLYDGSWIRHLSDPKAGPTFQIILSAVPSLKESTKRMVPDADIYDIDLFRTDKKTIDIMHRLNKTVVCYFSAGTYEPSRPDSRKFSNADLGNRLAQWPSEKWVKLGSTAVRRIMADRMQLAKEKGCDAIDPDNIDAYGAARETTVTSSLTGNNGNGLRLTRQDSVHYIQFLSQTAAKFNLAVGLKNGLEILADVRPYVHFAVNEECVASQECNRYLDFITKDKRPVFHIEYPAESTLLGGLGVGDRTLGGAPGRTKKIGDSERKKYCAAKSTEKVKESPFFQTVLKMRKLDGWVTYCNGSVATTPITEDVTSSGGRFSRFVLEGGANGTDVEVGEMDEWTRRVAAEDGYPFAPGMGSERFVSDEELEDVHIAQGWALRKEVTNTTDEKISRSF